MESSYQISTNQIALLLVTHFGYLSLFDADTVYYLFRKTVPCYVQSEEKVYQGYELTII